MRNRISLIVTERQANRLWAIARNKNHKVRPWSATELDKLMKHHNCIDADGNPSHFMVPIFRGGMKFYEHLCEVVAGPVPPYCLDAESIDQIKLI